MSTKPTTDELAAMVERLLRHDDGEGDAPVFLPEVRAEAIALLVRHMEGNQVLPKRTFKVAIYQTAAAYRTAHVEIEATSDEAAFLEAAAKYGTEDAPGYGELVFEDLDHGTWCQKIEVAILGDDGEPTYGPDTTYED